VESDALDLKNNAQCTMHSAQWKNIKQILMLLIFLVFSFAGAARAENAIGKFTEKAGIAKQDISDSEARLAKLKKEYNETRQNIEQIKALKDGGGIQVFFNGLSLKFLLNRGNNLAYKIYTLETGIRELTEDYFTYASIIIDEYNNAIKDCIDKKCDNLQEIYDNRKEWVKVAADYGDLLNIDLSAFKLLSGNNKGASDDIRDYLQKKIVQADQRLFILEEENGMRDLVTKAGLKLDMKERFENDRKISELKKLKEDLQKEMDKIK
jgi:GTPase SAR1 family protein